MHPFVFKLVPSLDYNGTFHNKTTKSSTLDLSLYFQFFVVDYIMCFPPYNAFALFAYLVCVSLLLLKLKKLSVTQL